MDSKVRPPPFLLVFAPCFVGEKGGFGRKRTVNAERSTLNAEVREGVVMKANRVVINALLSGTVGLLMSCKPEQPKPAAVRDNAPHPVVHEKVESSAATPAPAAGRVRLVIELPKPQFIGTQKDIASSNNDHDNSSKLGEGKDKEYIETYEGRPFAVNGVKGRYVRFTSRGNTSNGMNHYTEVEVYGRK